MFKYTIKSKDLNQQNIIQQERRLNSAQIVKNKYYTEVAQKLGELMRRQLVARDKDFRRKQTTSLQLVKMSAYQSRVPKLPPRKFDLHSREQLQQQKREMIEHFRYDLSKKRQKLVLSKQRELQEKANRIKWMKKQNKQAFRIKSSFHQMNKQKQIDMMRQLKNRTREQKYRIQKQHQLDNTFNIWERKLKPAKQIKIK